MSLGPEAAPTQEKEAAQQIRSQLAVYALGLNEGGEVSLERDVLDASGQKRKVTVRFHSYGSPEDFSARLTLSHPLSKATKPILDPINNERVLTDVDPYFTLSRDDKLEHFSFGNNPPIRSGDEVANEMTDWVGLFVASEQSGQ